MRHTPKNCEPFQLMISELLDGELNQADSLAVQKHLDNCTQCRHTASAFQQANNAVANLANHRQPDLPQKINGQQTARGSAPSNPNTLRRWLMIAAAVVVLVGLSAAFVQTTSPVSAKEFSAQEFARPLKDLHLLNMQQASDQELMLRALNMDLRAMRLELNQIPDSKEQDGLKSEIDLMLAKVRQFDSL